MAISPLAKIHPTSLVSEQANIADNVIIGPFCIVEDNVTIGEGTELVSHVVVKGTTEIGKDNKVYSFVTIGEVNQDLKYNNEDTKTIIGDRNSIRENVTIHRGTVQGLGYTQVGNNNLLMVGVHVAHDCVIGDGNVLANNVTLGGHVRIDNFTTIGGLSAVHQFVHIGSYVMVGGCSGLTLDVPPYLLVQGNHAFVMGLNIIGLRRRDFDDFQINQIKEAYRIIYMQGKVLSEALVELEQLASTTTPVSLFVRFLKDYDNKRGLCRPERK